MSTPAPTPPPSATPPASSTGPQGPFGPTHRGDKRTAGVICVAIAAALLLAYRAPSAEAVAAAQTPAVSDAEPFNLNAAMRLAGEQVPAEVESYYFFAFTDDKPASEEIAELGEKLVLAAAENDCLGISGPDAERNRRNLLGALAAHRDESLSGLTIIYVGPAVHATELTGAAKAAGAELRYVVYPAAKSPI